MTTRADLVKKIEEKLRSANGDFMLTVKSVAKQVKDSIDAKSNATVYAKNVLLSHVIEDAEMPKTFDGTNVEVLDKKIQEETVAFNNTVSAAFAQSYIECNTINSKLFYFKSNCTTQVDLIKSTAIQPVISSIESQVYGFGDKIVDAADYGSKVSNIPNDFYDCFDNAVKSSNETESFIVCRDRICDSYNNYNFADQVECIGNITVIELK